MTERPTFVIHLQPAAGVDGYIALRGVLKVALRRFGMKATAVRRDPPLAPALDCATKPGDGEGQAAALR